MSWIDEASRSDEPLRCRPFIERLRASADVMTVYETYELVNLAADHFGRWLVEYDFSLVSSPNRDAEAEADAWLCLWSATVDALCEQVPELRRPDLVRQRDLAAVQQALKKHLTLCRQRPLVAAWSSAASRLGIACTWLHLPTLGRTLYRVAVYPPHTVGRWR
jgi:hypothetical protein